MTKPKLHPHHPKLSGRGVPQRYFLALFAWPFEGPKVFVCKHCGALYVADDEATGYGGQCVVNIPPPKDPPRRGIQKKE